MIALPASFVDRIVRLHGSTGRAWLIRLPELIAHYAERWSLRVYPPLNSLTYNLITPAVREDGLKLVLKLGVPNPELVTEGEALVVFGGHGAAWLHARDPEGGALLLERVVPGDSLADCADDLVASRIACQVMADLWKPAPQAHNFPTVADWAKGFSRLRAHFKGGTGPFPADMVAEAENIYVDLLASAEEPVVLHGDLHHWNLLSSERAGWLAIDPKGVVGERAYEIGAWMRNPYPGMLQWEAPEKKLQQRLEVMSSELGMDRRRLKKWAFGQAVLSAWWSYEDGETGMDHWLSIASLLSGLDA